MRKILLKIWPGFLDLPKIWKSWVQTLSKVKLTTCFHEFSEYESTNFSYQILCNICFDFSYALNWDKKCLVWPIRNLFSFSTERYCWKIRRFVLGKFVKTCRELDRSQGRIRNQIENGNKNRRTSSFQGKFWSKRRDWHGFHHQWGVWQDFEKCLQFRKFIRSIYLPVENLIVQIHFLLLPVGFSIMIFGAYGQSHKVL